MKNNGKPAAKKAGRTLLAASLALVARENGGEKFLACAACETYLGKISDNYKTHCILEERPVSASNPLIGDPARFIDEGAQFRQFYCPGCGTLIENEIAVANDPILHDIQLRL